MFFNFISWVQDVMRLKVQLPKLMDAIKVDNPYCNHVDFLWSIKVNEHVNDPVRKILHKTDNMEWKYLGPSATQSATVDNHNESNDTVKRSLIPTNDPNFAEDLDYLTRNLDAIIASSIPRLIDDKDAAEFERGQEVQKILFGNLIEFLQSTEKKYGRFWGGSTNEFSGWRPKLKENEYEKYEGLSKRQSQNQEFQSLSKTDQTVA